MSPKSDAEGPSLPFEDTRSGPAFRAQSGVVWESLSTTGKIHSSPCFLRAQMPYNRTWPRARSSVGKSVCLLSRGSGVRIPPGAPQSSMYFTHVLRSLTTGRYYTGSTSNLQARLIQHNSDQSTSTKHRGPWELMHQEQFNTLAEAVGRERYLKSGKGRDDLKRILKEQIQ